MMQRSQQSAEHPLIRSTAIAAFPQRIRVVVVDDSPEFLDVVCGLLQMEESIEIIGKAGDGTAAIQAAAELRPDLILMDVHMPYMSGLTAALLLSEHFPAIKVVLMSSEDSLPMRISYKSSGAQAFVYKPAFREQFFATLHRFYGWREAEAELASCVAEP